MGLSDTETRLYLMFFHFSIIMLVTKKKGSKFNQGSYDSFFHNIENNLRELGFGDVSVNKKMKDFNKVLYDILLKIDLKKEEIDSFKINSRIVKKYFNSLVSKETTKLEGFNDYFSNFYNFCFELSLSNMVEDCIKFKY